MRRRLWALGAIVAALAIVAAIPAAAGGAARPSCAARRWSGCRRRSRAPGADPRRQRRRVAVGLDFGRVELSQGGFVSVKVKGLVIDPNAASAAAGTNPSPCSGCSSAASTPRPGSTTCSATRSRPRPGSARGMRRRSSSSPSPDPCIAPIVFVTSNGGSWFASTGG